MLIFGGVVNGLTVFNLTVVNYNSFYTLLPLKLNDDHTRIETSRRHLLTGVEDFSFYGNEVLGR